MKLPANQIRLIGGLLFGSVAMGVAWMGYGQALEPFLQREREACGTILELRGKIEGARNGIKEVKEEEMEMARARRQLEQFRGELPAGSTMFSFPNRMKAYFTRFGFAESTTRLNTSRKEPELRGYERTFWAVDLPIKNQAHALRGMLAAVADLESSEPFVRVLDLAVRPDPDDPLRRTVVLNLSALVRE